MKAAKRDLGLFPGPQLAGMATKDRKSLQKTLRRKEFMSQPQGLRWPAWSGRPNMGAGGHVVIQECQGCLRRPDLFYHSGSLCPAEQGNWSLNLTAWFQSALLTQRWKGPHLYNLILETQGMAHWPQNMYHIISMLKCLRLCNRTWCLLFQMRFKVL